MGTRRYVNIPCKCGSGLKYKKCCQKLDDYIDEAPKAIKPNNLIVTIPLSLIAARESSFDSFLISLQEFPTRQTIRLLCLLNALYKQLRARETQELLAEKLLSETDSKKVIRILKSLPKHTFVNERQIFILLRMLFYLDETKVQGLDIKQLGRLLLGANELIDIEYASKRHESDIEAIELELVGFFIRQLPAYEDDLRVALPRTHVLMNTIVPKLVESENYINLLEEFEKEIGFSLVRYLSLTFAFAAAWIKPNSALELDLASKDISNFFKNTNATEEEINKITDAITLDYQEYREEIRKEIKNIRQSQYDFLTFTRYPLVRFDNAIYPISFRLLLNKLGHYVYWILHEHFKKLGESELDKFFRFFGEIYERYIIELLTPIFPQMVTNIRMPGKQRGHKGEIDILVPEKDALTIIEIKSSRLNLQTVKSGDIEMFMEGLNQTIFKPAEQLSSAINGLMSNQFDIDIDLSNYKTIYPVVVHFSPFPQGPVIRKILDKELEKRGLLQQHSVAQLTLFDVEELEVSTGLFENYGFAELLRRKTSVSELCAESFKYFIYSEYRQTMPNSCMKDRWDSLAEMMRDNLFPKK